MFARTEEVELLVFDARELRRAALRHQLCIERGVHGVQQVAQRKFDGATAVGAGVAGLEVEAGQVAGAGPVQFGQAPRHDGALRQQALVGLQGVCDQLRCGFGERRGGVCPRRASRARG